MRDTAGQPVCESEPYWWLLAQSSGPSRALGDTPWVVWLASRRMGIFDRWWGTRKLEDPAALRDALFVAASTGDAPAVAELCQKHRATILESFGQWLKVPAEIRADPTRVRAYAQGLMTVANFMADIGYAGPLDQLMPPAADNPITRYQTQIEHARKLMDGQHFADALVELEGLIGALSKVEGSAVDRYLPLARGCVSECQFHSGHVQAAIAPARDALAGCERIGDHQGVIAYRRNLYEIHRYLGESEPAAHFAELLASSLDVEGDVEQARWYHTQATVVRAGEPLNRVILLVGGSRYELAAIPKGLSDRVQFVFQRNRITLQPATSGVQRAMALGGAARYSEALAALEDAARQDRYDPQPSYLAGLTLLHLKRYDDAVDSYARCECLAPGWYHARADRWLAEQLAIGKLDHGTLLNHLELTDGSAPPERKLEIASRVLIVAPSLAPFHLHRGKALLELGREPEAVQAFRDGLAHDGDPGTRTRLLVELGGRLSGPERRRHLEAAMELDGDRISSAMACVMLAQDSQPS